MKKYRVDCVYRVEQIIEAVDKEDALDRMAGIIDTNDLEEIAMLVSVKCNEVKEEEEQEDE